MTSIARILVVDDEASIRFFLEEALARDGHKVVAVESGEAALELIASQEFDLALIDLKLKGVGGMEVLASLRRQSPDMSVIVLTGHGSMETAVEALRQGAHDYLFKPCKTVQLRESVRTGLLKRQRELQQRKLLSQLEQSLTSSLEEIRATVVEPSALPGPFITEPAVEEEARFLQRQGLIVDFMRHVITLDGHLLELSPTEFDLMAYLVSETPRVISPQELVREVQGYESEPWEARDMVRYHVYRIRQKVKAATGRTNVIRTVRGVGYTVGE
jgi:two-component system KDP operon response regulator KdpE